MIEDQEKKMLSMKGLWLEADTEVSQRVGNLRLGEANWNGR